MLRTDHRSLNRRTSAEATRRRNNQPMCANQIPRVTAWGSAARSVLAWWARWSALHDSAEFWKAAAPKTSMAHRTGGDARYVRWANRRWYPAVIARPHRVYITTASASVAADGFTMTQITPTMPAT